MQTQQPNQPPQVLTQQQQKQKRRQKILSRSNQTTTITSTNPNPRSQIVQPEHLPSSHECNPQRVQSKQEAMTAYQMFKASQNYEKNKIWMEWGCLGIGVLVGVGFVGGVWGAVVFGVVLALVCVLTLSNQLIQAHNISKFTSSPSSQNPLLQKLSNIKQLQIANKVLKIQAAFSPVNKLVASFFGTVVILGSIGVGMASV